MTKNNAGERNRLIEQYAGLVNKVAYRIIARLPASVEVDDLRSVGVIGLIDAIDRYDPSRGPFENYVEFRIRGAMMDELRHLDWVPRSVRKKAGALDKTCKRLLGALGREPTDEEMAEAMGFSVEEYREFASEAQAVSIVFTEDLGLKDGDLLEVLPDQKAPDLDACLDAHVRHSQLRRAMRELLSDRERLVVALSYFEEMNLREIGELIGVTESRISQIRSKAVRVLREAMGDEISAVA